jgi:DNA-binding response OmpR family regulator
MRTVLWVEDDTDILGIAALSALNHGWSLFPETDGKTALERYRQFRPQAIVIDLKLPSAPGQELFSGLDLCQEIRKTDKQTPIVIASGADPVAVKSAAMAGEANWSFLKPLDFDDVFDRLDILVDRIQDKRKAATHNSNRNLICLGFVILFALVLGGIAFSCHVQDVYNARRDGELQQLKIDMDKEQARRFEDFMRTIVREDDQRMIEFERRLHDVESNIGAQWIDNRNMWRALDKAGIKVPGSKKGQ